MITKLPHGFCVSCDFCSTEVELRAATRDAVITRITGMGWVQEKADEKKRELVQKCPCCVESQVPVQTSVVRH